MEKVILAGIFLIAALCFITGSLAAAAGHTEIPQISLQLLALGVLFLCLFAIFLMMAIMEMRAELKSLRTPPAFR